MKLRRKVIQSILIIPICVLICFGSEKSAPVPIYYGLNESHSDDWARVDKNGIIGITVFQHHEPDSIDGNLVYKTIAPDGTECTEIVTSGNRLEISVLLFDESNIPHIFVATSSNTNQAIRHFYKDNDEWEEEKVIDFMNEGGKYIYELSADIGPDGTYHLLVLKTRSNPDSNDYWYAYLEANLYHISGFINNWTKVLIRGYDTFYTMDEYSKMSGRQDIQVDKDGYAHIIFGEQLNGSDWQNGNTALQYGSNRTGEWLFETAVEHDPSSRNSTGWYPSLCLNSENVPHISCCCIDRVRTGSAINAKLVFVTKLGHNNWQSEIIASRDDGYYGGDGRNYTGGLTHFVFDRDNTPHIVFSDIASSHSNGNYFNLGNIRYAKRESGTWSITKIYQHPLPAGRYSATEMYDLCLLIPDETNEIKIVGQELIVLNETSYQCNLVDYTISQNEQNTDGEILLNEWNLSQNYPNPFNPATTIQYSISKTEKVLVSVYDLRGNLIENLVNQQQNAGEYHVVWNASNYCSGVYLYQIQAGEFNQVKRCVYLK